MADRVMLPVTDRGSEPYWSGLAEGRLVLQQCRACARRSWPPRPLCSSCQGEDLAWRPVEGTGEVYSWVVTHQVYGADFADLVPYTIVLVRLDEQEDILIPGRLRSAAEASQGLRVRVAPERLTKDLAQIAWASA